MKDEFTAADRNALREYIQSESGRKFLLLLVGQETALLAETHGPKTTMERQNQLINRHGGVYWVRTLIDDMINTK